MIFYDMDRKIFFSFTLFDLRKLIGASILFFLALVIGVKEAGEPSTMLQVDYFSEEISLTIQAHQHRHKTILSAPCAKRISFSARKSFELEP